MRPAIASDPGHEEYFYCYDDADADSICAFQQYVDAQAVRDFLTTGQYDAYLREVDPLLAGPPTNHDAYNSVEQGVRAVVVMMISGITIQPVAHANWEAFARLFEAKGSPHYCWCTLHQLCGGRKSIDTPKKAAMLTLVETGTPIGLLACKGTEPVGWCSVAPRESYARLERSKTMPRVTPPETPTWTVLCFFVARPYRHQRIASAMLEGAVAYARDQGADFIEGYPFDSAGVSSTHRGHSRMFKGCGFERDGTRWFKRLGRDDGATLRSVAG